MITTSFTGHQHCIIWLSKKSSSLGVTASWSIYHMKDGQISSTTNQDLTHHCAQMYAIHLFHNWQWLGKVLKYLHANFKRVSPIIPSHILVARILRSANNTQYVYIFLTSTLNDNMNILDKHYNPTYAMLAVNSWTIKYKSLGHLALRRPVSIFFRLNIFLIFRYATRILIIGPISSTWSVSVIHS